MKKNAGRKWGRQKVDIEVENTIKLTECSIYEKDTREFKKGRVWKEVNGEGVVFGLIYMMLKWKNRGLNKGSIKRFWINRAVGEK